MQPDMEASATPAMTSARPFFMMCPFLGSSGMRRVAAGDPLATSTAIRAPCALETAALTHALTPLQAKGRAGSPSLRAPPMNRQSVVYRPLQSETRSLSSIDDKRRLIGHGGTDAAFQENRMNSNRKLVRWGALAL